MTERPNSEALQTVGCFCPGLMEGKRKAPKTGRSSAGEEQTTCGLAQRLAVVKAVGCHSDLTRPVSWLGSISFGTHPCTKGASCFTGRRRRRLPSTQRVSERPAMQGAGRPAEETETGGPGYPRTRSLDGIHLLIGTADSTGADGHTLQKAGCAGCLAGSKANAPPVGDAIGGSGCYLDGCRGMRVAPPLLPLARRLGREPIEMVPLQSG